MKILMTTYYYDFARYFLYLQNQFEIYLNHNIEFKHICFYPSAYFYFKDNDVDADLAYKLIDNIKIDDINELLKKNKYKGLNLDEVIQFNYNSQKMFGLEKKQELKITAIKYIKYFEKLFREENFDIFISSGDTRMVTEIAIYFAKKNNVDTWYFEQGPFDTTMIDNKGVNCNISFNNTKELDSDINTTLLKKFIKNYKSGKRKKFQESRELNIPYKYKLDLIYLYTPFFLRNLVPINLQTGESFFSKIIYSKIKKTTKKIKNKIINKKKTTYPNNIISLILQVPVDAQMIVHSPNYDSFYTMLVDVYNNIPSNYNLVVREHPGNKGNYDRRIYNFIKNHERVYLINEGGLDTLLKKSELIILNNSTVGIEALTYYKTVITLGKAYYNRENVVYNLKKKENLNLLIKKALEKGTNEESINKFLYNFIFNYLYYGHFQDYKLINGQKIVKDIINNE
jgi:capsular polysaccharide export protein